jgi:predicted transcriptional regulator
MRNSQTRRPPGLGRAEQAVMDCVWAHGPISAEACRKALRAVWPMKDSTVRTVLRRLEEKGYVSHAIDGRAFVYRASERRASVATRAVQHIIDRFCGGSAEELLIGMVDHDVLSSQQLDRLARTIAARKRGKP